MNFFFIPTGKAGLWPTGQYGLPMPKAGCPNNWFDGRRFRDVDSGNLIDRKIYDSLHLAGWISREGTTVIHSPRLTLCFSLFLL